MGDKPVKKRRKPHGKMMNQPKDKMRRAGKNKSDAETLAELQGRAESALHLLDSETADEIVGEQTPEYKKLIQGTQAIMAMEWSVMRTHGLRENAASLKAGSQALLMMSTLVHYAYALGIQRGQESPTVGETE